MTSCQKNPSKACTVIKSIYGKYVNFLENHLTSILLLAIRIWIGLVFYKSGLTKFSNIDQAILLFTYEYDVPLLSPAFAAIMAMVFEIGCGVSIILGLMTRIFALPLIGMTLVIQFFVFQNIEHLYWLFLLSTLAVYGGGKLSLEVAMAKLCSLKS